MQQHRDLTLNGTLHSKRTDGNVMLVVNADNYVMAEYNMLTGETVWQRLVLAPQREKVETWLAESYPALTVANAIPAKRRKR